MLASSVVRAYIKASSAVVSAYWVLISCSVYMMLLRLRCYGSMIALLHEEVKLFIKLIACVAYY